MRFENRSTRAGLRPRSDDADWKPVLTGELAAVALAQSRYPRATRWLPYSVAQGYAGLAVLWGYLDSCFAGEGWDVTGREHLELAIRSAERQQDQELPVGLFAGLSGVAFAGWQLSRQGTRYRRLLTRLDNLICTRAIVIADGLRVQRQGVAVSEFDVISGLSGVGAYLLCRRDQPGPAAALEAVIRSLVELVADDSCVPRWHTPAFLLGDEGMKATYRHGNMNCGLAHGILGPLAFLSLANQAGSTTAGLPGAIARIADWVCANRYDDSWGTNWSTAVPLEPTVGSEAGELRAGSARSAPDGPSRSAWCYGSPGVARALWLASVVLDRDDYRSEAISAMEAVFRRPVNIRRIDSPTVCHGVAGLLEITLRFANDTGYPPFLDESGKLVQQILEHYRPDSLLGFRSLEVGDHEVDQPGLLDGAPGVALVLLAAATNVEPTWDRLFLLS
jgi:hypothetical protein